MATQTGSIDMAAMAEAAKTANNYVTDLGDSGIRVHPADDADNYAAIDANGMSVVRDSESVAHFGEETRIGKSGESHMELDYHSLQLVDKEGGYYFHVSDMRNEDGSITEAFEGDGTTTEFNVMVAVSSVIWVKVNGASASYTRYETTFVLSSAPASGATVEICYVPTNTWKSLVKAYTLGIRKAGRIGLMSVAEGYNNTASGAYSHAEGTYSTASDYRAHAEGRATTASGHDSHAEGDGTEASGSYSHAEGLNSKATDSCSHAEGYNSTASGGFSHAQNEGTVAAYDSQTAIGKYNANDPNNAFEIGNGTADDARSNAYAVAWDGTVTAAGEVTGATAEAVLTLASGVTATTAKAKRSGNLVTVYIDALHVAAELANHGTAAVATVPSGYRPAYTAYAQLAGWNQGGSYATVGTDGSVTVNNQSGAAIPVARALGLMLTYVM